MGEKLIETRFTVTAVEVGLAVSVGVSVSVDGTTVGVGEEAAAVRVASAMTVCMNGVAGVCDGIAEGVWVGICSPPAKAGIPAVVVRVTVPEFIPGRDVCVGTGAAACVFTSVTPPLLGFVAAGDAALALITAVVATGVFAAFVGSEADVANVDAGTDVND